MTHKEHTVADSVHDSAHKFAASPAERSAIRISSREYLPDHNRRLAHPADSPENDQRQAPSRTELDQLFRLDSERVISND
jgi:hypothetical protein